MRILAFDTATAATSVALCDVGSRPGAGRVDLEVRDDPAPGARPGHTRVLLALIEDVLAQGGGWDTVERIAVGVGPGTFTGLRIGIASARSLARARGLDLVGVSTLRSLAAAARGATPRSAIVAVIDARRGEAFAAAWGQGDDPAVAAPLLSPSVLAPEQLAGACARLDAGALAVGDGAIRFRATLEGAGVVVSSGDSPLHRVTAREHCRIAAAIQPGDPEGVLPVYLRIPDAELTRPPS